MASAFSKAWILLKRFNNPQDEEDSYGNVSYRDHPLHGQQGYEGGMTPEEMMERQNASSFDPRIKEPQGHPDAEPFMPHDEPPNPFPRQGGFEPQRGSMTPMEMERMMQALEESQRGYPSEYVENDESQLIDYQKPERDFDDKAPQHADFDAGRPQTVPMSPRGSVRGMGERQAYDKAKKPDWWRHLSGE
tara:strand:+ start:432 stop:1001 length:570 start_codon:yes stop_codon:yes gene_type:complete